MLLRALASLKAAGVGFRACLVGPGPLLTAHRRLSARLGLDDRVAIPGHVDHARPYLRLADVFVLPSFEQGSGSVALLEALQMGTAVVTSDLRTALAGRGRELFEERFSAGPLVAGLREVYAELGVSA